MAFLSILIMAKEHSFMGINTGEGERKAKRNHFKSQKRNIKIKLLLLLYLCKLIVKWKIKN